MQDTQLHTVRPCAPHSWKYQPHIQSSQASIKSIAHGPLVAPANRSGAVLTSYRAGIQGMHTCTHAQEGSVYFFHQIFFKNKDHAGTVDDHNTTYYYLTYCRYMEQSVFQCSSRYFDIKDVKPHLVCLPLWNHAVVVVVVLQVVCGALDRRPLNLPPYPPPPELVNYHWEGSHYVGTKCTYNRCSQIPPLAACFPATSILNKNGLVWKITHSF